jgi:hypothetical protein
MAGFPFCLQHNIFLFCNSFKINLGKSFQFTKYSTISDFIDLNDGASRRVLWESKSSSKTEAAIPFDGIPYFLVGNHVLECQHGVDRNVYQKNKHASKFQVIFPTVC